MKRAYFKGAKFQGEVRPFLRSRFLWRQEPGFCFSWPLPPLSHSLPESPETYRLGKERFFSQPVNIFFHKFLKGS